MTSPASLTRPRWLAAAYSRLGARRGTNMDAFVVCAEEGLFVLADGMGSTPRGGEAAAMAVAEFADHLVAGSRDEACIHAAVDALQKRMVERFAPTGRLTGATTLCAAVADGSTLSVVNLGDSRCHLLRAGALTRLTTDHTVAAHLVAVGAAEPDSPLARRTANHLRRYLGNPAGATADVSSHRLLPGDVLLLSTDGLHTVLAAEQITEILLAGEDLAETAHRLVSAAADGGGTDDATAVVVRAVR